MADINEAGGEETVAEIEKARCKAEFVRTDFSSEDDIASLVRGIAKRQGRCRLGCGSTPSR